MPLDDQSVASDRTCERHPSSAAVAECDECGLALCIRCTVPVRGRAIGPECLAVVVGPDLTVHDAARRRARPSFPAIGASFAVAVAAGLLPWARFGPGSGPFGGWSASSKWSLLAAIAAVLGLALWAIAGLGRLAPGRRWMLGLRVLSLAVVAGSVLYLLAPSVVPASVGPWVAAASGGVALAGTILAPTRTVPHE